MISKTEFIEKKWNKQISFKYCDDFFDAYKDNHKITILNDGIILKGKHIDTVDTVKIYKQGFDELFGLYYDSHHNIQSLQIGDVINYDSYRNRNRIGTIAKINRKRNEKKTISTIKTTANCPTTQGGQYISHDTVTVDNIYINHNGTQVQFDALKSDIMFHFSGTMQGVSQYEYIQKRYPNIHIIDIISSVKIENHE